MTDRLLRTVLRRAEALAAEPTADAVSDAALVRRFADTRDEAAFAAVVHRHGPLVWAVCRQSLPNPADAEDAFQATFLAMLQAAGTLPKVRSLGGWLHGVAVKVALKARRTAGRRKAREVTAAKPEGVAPQAEPQWADLHAAVHEEVERLPDALRTAFVLCDLQGVRQPDAAARLGWKAGTLTGRLTRARQQLMLKLTGRGLAPAAVAGSVAIGGAAAGGHLPAAMADKAFALLGAGADGGGNIGPTILELARGATEGAMATRTKWIVGSLVVAGGLMAGVGVNLLPSAVGQGAPGAAPPATQARPPATTPATGTAATGAAPAADPAAPGKPPAAGMGGLAAPMPMPGGQNHSGHAWEYLYVGKPSSSVEMAAALAKHGNAGWELVAFVESSPHDLKRFAEAMPKSALVSPDATTLMILKRQKGGENGAAGVPAIGSTFTGGGMAPAVVGWTGGTVGGEVRVPPASTIPSSGGPGLPPTQPRKGGGAPSATGAGALPPMPGGTPVIPNENKDGEVTLLRLKHADAETVLPFLAKLAKSGTVMAEPRLNAILLVNVDEQQAQTIQEVVKLLDVEGKSGMK